MTLTKISTKIIKYSFYLLFFLTPLILTPWNYELFEFNKMLLVYLLTIIITGTWLIKMVAEGEIRIQKTPLDLPILLFLIFNFLSFIFSIDRHVSFYGYYSRFHGGLLSTICYIILYYAFVTNSTPTSPNSQNSPNPLKSSKGKKEPRKVEQCSFRTALKIRFLRLLTSLRQLSGFSKSKAEKDKRKTIKSWPSGRFEMRHASPSRILRHLFLIILTSATLVSLYGILEHFGVDKNLWVQDVQNRVFSTLGQPNWLAAYLCIVLPLTIALALNSKHEARFSQETPLLRGNSKQLFKLKTQNSKLKTTTQMLKLRKMSERFKDLTCGFDICHLRFEIFTLLSLLFYLCLLFTKSRSGFLAFWATNALFALLNIIINIISLKSKNGGFTFNTPLVQKKVKQNQFSQSQKIFKKLLIINLLFLLITFFIGTPFGQINRYFSYSSLTQKILKRKALSPPPPPPGPALETGVTGSSEIRKIVWKGAIDIARHFPFFGTGVETFAFAYYRFRPKEHNLTSEWDFLYNKAHNEYLNYAATTGFLGLGAYLFLIGKFIWWNIKTLIYANRIRINANKRIIHNSRRFAKIREDSCESAAKSGNSSVLLIALVSGYASILVTNFFGFSVVVIALFFWLIPAISFVLSNSLKSQSSLSIKLPTIKPLNYLAIILILLFTFYFLLFTLKLWYADALFTQGLNFSKTDDYSTTYAFYKKAVDLNPSEPLYHDKLSLNLTELATLAFLENDASLSAELARQALSHSEKALAISPQNINFWKTRTRLFYTLSQINEVFLKEAVTSLKKAANLAPTDAKIAYNLALLYAEDNNLEKAIDTLSKTITLKPNYRDAHFALALFYKEKGLDKKAADELKFILEKINPEDEEVKNQLEEWKI